MNNFFFEDWQSILRILVMAPLSYAGLLFMLRISGNRTLSKMSVFDFIVTIALGSTLATVILSKDVVLFEGLLAFFLLILLQFIVTFASSRSKRLKKILHSEPRLLLYKGEFLRDAMKEARVSEQEMHQALRGSGIDDPTKAQEVILETNGKFNVIT